LLLEHPLLTQRYFFPRRERIASPFFVDCGDARLACYREERDPAAQTLIHFHGNGEVVADYLPDFAELFLGMGVNVFFAEYRGYGGSTGWPSLLSLLTDAAEIVRALGLAPERLVVFGRSLGSLPAIELAARYPDIGGLILESGIADPLERVLVRASPEELGLSREALEAEVKRYLDHERKLGGYKGPLLVLHAERDGLIDASHARRNFGWAAGEEKELRLLPRGDHNSIFSENLAGYIEALRGFLARCRRGR
jgi:hypothetical protein